MDNFLSLFFIIYRLQKEKNFKIVKVVVFGCAVSLRLFKIEQFFLFEKNNRGYHIPRIDLGKSKKSYSCFKTCLFFLELPLELSILNT